MITPCPVCTWPIVESSHYDRDLCMTVETDSTCPACGYSRSFSYGTTRVEVGGRVFVWTWRSKAKTIRWYKKLIKRTIEAEKARRAAHVSGD